MKNRARNEQQKTRLKEIGLLIKNFRLSNGFTQTEFIKNTGLTIHTNSLQNLESGKDVTLTVVLECIDGLGLTISEFFAGMN